LIRKILHPEFLCFQAATGRALYKNWIQVQNVSITSTARKHFHAFIRTIAFTAIAMTGIMYGCPQLVVSSYMVADLYAAASALLQQQRLTKL
jgi:hypothetical protein